MRQILIALFLSFLKWFLQAALRSWSSPCKSPLLCGKKVRKQFKIVYSCEVGDPVHLCWSITPLHSAVFTPAQELVKTNDIVKLLHLDKGILKQGKVKNI